MNNEEILDQVYDAMEGSTASLDYSERHNINALACLTVTNDEQAALIAAHLEERLAGKTVVDVGGGIGLLALHLGQIAKRVYCIEGNPMWSWVFAGTLLHHKPRNVSFLFGAADEFVGIVRADVAVICTHSDISGMRLLAAQFAPCVIDVYGELIEEMPEAFDPVARRLRSMT